MRLCWLRGILHVSYQENGRRRRISLGTTDIAKARVLLAEFKSPPLKPQGDRAWVYFVRCECASGFIKIGTATNIISRLDDLQSGSPYRITLLRLVPAGIALERRLQKKFVHLRERGEWFRPGDDLLAEIEARRQDDPREKSDDLDDQMFVDLLGSFVTPRDTTTQVGGVV